MTVARQMATMNKLAPGRFLLGVGVGGEDRHEIEVCGVDPTTRGRRTDESLEILNLLRPGNPVDYPGRFFHLDDAVIQPPLGAEIPIVIGGRSDAALRRTARFGHGWIGAWCSPRRFAEAVTSIDSTAAELGRTVSWLHGYQPWIGVGDSVDEARDRVATVMEDFYRVPFEMFERYTPMGTPADIVSALSPYVEAGCRMFNMKIVAGTEEASIEAAAEITADLRNVGGPA
jgi:alkanesulfonate monooxygenase SsuD/methylene tetrahydromethanopterin reductase-like flavin-dependent oxidoreductase (luciferase family)